MRRTIFILAPWFRVVAGVAPEAHEKESCANVQLADCEKQDVTDKALSDLTWRKRNADGTVTKWLQQVAGSFAVFGKVSSFISASQDVDPSMFMNARKG